MKRIIIIGSGPAGLTAAIYAARGGLDTIVIAGSTPGGQLMLTTEVENYPGFEMGILGPELISRMRRQAERFEVKFIDEDATEVDFSSRPYKVMAGSDVYTSDVVIIATGASAKWLGLKSEQRLRGRGVSACATCDGFFFKGKDVAVVGGGDTAMEEAIFLTKFVNQVTVIHRRDRLRASRILQERAFKNSKIKFRWNSVITDIQGESVVRGVRLKDTVTGEVSEFECQGVFIAVGHTPNTKLFQGQVEMDDKSYILVKNGTSTSVPGVFVAGDVYDYKYRQAITAAASGCRAAIDAINYLEAQEA